MNIELLKTITILYVEDEPSLREEIYQNILPFVKDVIVAQDGKEGLETFLQNRDKIDIIVSDILMPNMTGIEMIDEIRKIDTETPVIYTTAFNDTKYMQKTITQMIVAYILKPVDVELLLDSIEKASMKIENKRLKESLLQMNADLEEEVKLKTNALRLQNIDLHSQLFTDNLTLLFNRKALRRDIHEMNNPKIILLDIDSFKNVNDLYGEYIGNLILIKVSLLVHEYSMQNNYIAYRIGSDEFTMLKDRYDEDDDDFDAEYQAIAQEIQKKISATPIRIEEYDIEIIINVTIGISISHKEEVLETADMALKKAKKDRVPYIIYKEEHSTKKVHKNEIKWTKIIVNAIEEDEIVPYYQPIMDKDENILKYESLMRIVHGEDVHSPYFFLDIAKKVKFYTKLEMLMIQKVLMKVKDTQSTININLSIQDILNKEFMLSIYKELEENKIGHLVTFEILESENIKDYEKVVEFIEDARRLNCLIAIDDFGSGFSNFEYLLKLKPDYIKIDGSLVKNVHEDKNSYLIVKTINEFAHNLGMKTVAEFVHCKEVFDILKELEVDEFQGYYLGEPKREFRS